MQPANPRSDLCHNAVTVLNKLAYFVHQQVAIKMGDGKHLRRRLRSLIMPRALCSCSIATAGAPNIRENDRVEPGAYYNVHHRVAAHEQQISDIGVQGIEPSVQTERRAEPIR